VKKDIDQRYGERIVRKGGQILFDHHIYTSRKLQDRVGHCVKVKGYGYGAIDVSLLSEQTTGIGGKVILYV